VLAVPSIVGTWKLVAAAAKDRSGNPLPTPYGGVRWAASPSMPTAG